MAELRKNTAKHKLQEGGLVTVASGLMSPDMVEFLGQFGFDAVWLEAEHGPIDFGDISNLTRASDLWNMTSIVRVNLNLPGVIYRTLDVGAQAVVVPHINTANEAQEVVQAVKFPPIGSRGSPGGLARQAIGVDRFPAKANDETMAMVLLEDIVAFDNLSEILAVDHIDVYFIGPGDLSLSMGHIGQPNHPEVVATVNHAIKQITSAGKVAGTVANEDNVEDLIQRGVRVLYSGWNAWVAAGANSYLNKVASASNATD